MDNNNDKDRNNKSQHKLFKIWYAFNLANYDNKNSSWYEY